MTALERYPGLHICGTHDGYFKAEEEEALVAEIREAGTEMLFCALGPPRPAEIWIQKHKKNLAPLVAIGVGGSFNVMAGIDQRALPGCRAFIWSGSTGRCEIQNAFIGLQQSQNLCKPFANKREDKFKNNPKI
jgi:hypothetical protein